MGLILFALFVGVPVAEIALFVMVGGQIGVLATIAIVILTAVAGAALVRHQGIETAMRARRDMESNRIPTGAMTEGLAILVAGVLLLTPGFLTDTIGFALLVPPVRRSVIKWVGAWLAARVTVVDMASRTAGRPGGGYPGREYRGREEIIEGEAVEIDPNADGGDEEPRPTISDRRNGGSSPWRPS